MRRNFWSVLALMAVLCTLTACNSCNAPAVELFGSGQKCGDPVYTGPQCLPKLNLPDPFCLPAPVAAAPCPTPVAAAPVPQGPACGPLPADAKVGEVWCCEFVQPPAAAPVTVEVEPARTEWQRIDCRDGSTDCWSLVTVPARFETRYSAPPPGYYEWRRNTKCAPPVAVAAPAPCK